MENKGGFTLTTVPLSLSVVSSAVLTHYCTSGTLTRWHCVWLCLGVCVIRTEKCVRDGRRRVDHVHVYEGGMYTQVVVFECCKQTATFSRQPVLLFLTSTGKLVAQLVPVRAAFITFSLMEAPALFHPSGNKKPGNYCKVCCWGCLSTLVTVININRNTSSFNNSYSCLLDC